MTNANSVGVQMMSFVGMVLPRELMPTVEISGNAFTLDLHNDGELQSIDLSFAHGVLRLCWHVLQPAWATPNIVAMSGRETRGVATLIISGIRAFEWQHANECRYDGDLGELDYFEYTSLPDGLGTIRFVLSEECGEISVTASRCELLMT